MPNKFLDDTIKRKILNRAWDLFIRLPIFKKLFPAGIKADEFSQPADGRLFWHTHFLAAGENKIDLDKLKLAWTQCLEKAFSEFGVPFLVDSPSKVCYLHVKLVVDRVTNTQTQISIVEAVKLVCGYITKPLDWHAVSAEYVLHAAGQYHERRFSKTGLCLDSLRAERIDLDWGRMREEERSYRRFCRQEQKAIDELYYASYRDQNDSDALYDASHADETENPGATALCPSYYDDNVRDMNLDSDIDPDSNVRNSYVDAESVLSRDYDGWLLETPENQVAPDEPDEDVLDQTRDRTKLNRTLREIDRKFAFQRQFRRRQLIKMHPQMQFRDLHGTLWYDPHCGNYGLRGRAAPETTQHIKHFAASPLPESFNLFTVYLICLLVLLAVSFCIITLTIFQPSWMFGAGY